MVVAYQKRTGTGVWGGSWSGLVDGFCSQCYVLLLRNFFTGVYGQGFATLPLPMGTEGQNYTLGYGKWVKIKPLTIGKIAKLTTLEAILHEIGQIWPKFVTCFEKNVESSQNGQNLLKIYPWLRSLSQN